MSEPPSPERKGRPPGSSSFAWRAFFQQSTTPIFVLGKTRRLRFANSAWGKLTGLKPSDALGMVCSLRRHGAPLAAALAPTPEAEAGKPDCCRRTAPTGKNGPPWWDVRFEPLAGPEGLIGIVGFITVVGETVASVVRKMPAYVAELRERHGSAFTLDLFAGASPALERFRGQLRLAAESAAPAWLVGESGAGKETAARVIHHLGPRRNRAFVGLACAGLQPYLIESMLFGHGGVIAAGDMGTLYLKEPAALPRDMQQRFADAFAEPKPGSTRLICGSMRTASDEVASGKLVPEFHTDLAVLELRVPPLRERLAELPRLAAALLGDTPVEAAAIEVLKCQPWPGNIREFSEVLAAAAAAAGGAPLTKEHLPHELRVRAGAEPPPAPTRPLTLDPLLEAVERRLIALAMSRSQGNATKAAEMLGVFRTRLNRRLEALGVIRTDDPGP